VARQATASSESAVPAPPVPGRPSSSLATTVMRRVVIEVATVRWPSAWVPEEP
jgi:hypothetical protein